MNELAVVPSKPRRLAYFGTPDMAVPPLLALLDAGFDVPLVVTRADAKRGRGGATSPSPVAAAAQSRGVPVSHVVDDVLDAGVDLAVVVAYGRLLRRPVLERVPMINIHFSLLPRWRGAAPVERALLAGDTETGTCLMRIEEGLDTGPVFDRVVVPIAERATLASLRTALVDAGTEQLLRCLQDGLGEPQPQTGEATYAAKIDVFELRIDWSRSAPEIDRLVRVGGAWTMLRGKRIRVVVAEPFDNETVTNSPSATASVPAVSASGSGTISGVDVVTGSGILRLLTVQPEGKSAMLARDWANGARADGAVFGQ